MAYDLPKVKPYIFNGDVRNLPDMRANSIYYREPREPRSIKAPLVNPLPVRLL